MNTDYTAKITEIFYSVDEFCKQIEPQFKKKANDLLHFDFESTPEEPSHACRGEHKRVYAPLISIF